MRNSILVKDQPNEGDFEVSSESMIQLRSQSLALTTNDIQNEFDDFSLDNRKMGKKVKKVIFADQVLFIRGDERLQIPLTRISSANDSIRISGFSKLLSNKIEEKSLAKNKSKKFKFNNQSRRKNSLTNSHQANLDTSQLKKWNLIKENTFFFEKETANIT